MKEMILVYCREQSEPPLCVSREMAERMTR